MRGCAYPVEGDDVLVGHLGPVDGIQHVLAYELVHTLLGHHTAPAARENHRHIRGQAPISLTYLSILRQGFTPIFSATLSYGKSLSP